MTTVNDNVPDNKSLSLGNNKSEESVGIAKNVIWSWIGHFIFIIAGFLLPRFMDRQLGADMLGMWDFAWSFVGYLQLIQFDVGSSVNRYVAKYRAVNDNDGLNTAVTSVMLLQMTMAGVIMIATCAIIYSLPYLWKDKLGDLIPEARILIFLLGTSTALSFGFGSFSGVITGCHKWKMYNLISSGYHMGSTLVMIATLFIFNDIIALAIVYACERILISFTYLFAAHSVCPSLKIQLRFFKLSMAFSMLKFGGKGFAGSMARTLLYQTNNMLIIKFLGPAALALYVRPINLINKVKAFSSKFANTLTPIASQMQAKKDYVNLESLVIKSGMTGACIAFPVTIFFVVMGGPLMNFWMGEKYSNSLLFATLAVGHLFTMTNLPMSSVLMGMNAHGRPAVFNCISGVFSVITTYVILNTFKGGLVSVAVIIAIAIFINDGLNLPYVLFRKMKINIPRYIFVSWLKPLLCCLPFATVLLIMRFTLPAQQALIIGTAIAGTVLLVSYWVGIFTPEQKTKILKKFENIPIAGRVINGKRKFTI